MQKILIIEDDTFLSEMYATKLTQAGFKVEIADDGQKGIDKAKEGQPHQISASPGLTRTRARISGAGAIVK